MTDEDLSTLVLQSTVAMAVLYPNEDVTVWLAKAVEAADMSFNVESLAALADDLAQRKGRSFSVLGDILRRKHADRLEAEADMPHGAGGAGGTDGRERGLEATLRS